MKNRRNWWIEMGLAVFCMAAAAVILYCSGRLPFCLGQIDTFDPEAAAEQAGLAVTEELPDAEEPSKTASGQEGQRNPESRVRGGEPEPPAPSAAPEDAGYPERPVTMEEAYQMTAEELAPYLEQVDIPDGYEQAMLSAGFCGEAEDPWWSRKLYMSFHGDISVPGFGNPYFESGEAVTCSTGFEEAVYKNRQIRVMYGDGYVLTVGTDRAPDDSGIYLAAQSTQASADCRIGYYYYTRENASLIYRYDREQLQDMVTGRNADCRDLLIISQPQDKLIPSDVRGAAGPGVLWQGWYDDTVYMRMVDLVSGKMLAMFHIIIEERGGAFQITAIVDGRDTDLDEVSLTELKTEAVSGFFAVIGDPEEQCGDVVYYCSGRIQTKIDGETFDRWVREAFVEKVPKTYFTVALDYNDNMAVYRAQVPVKQDTLYAVTFNADAYGYVTVYFTGTGAVRQETVLGRPIAVEEFEPVAYDIRNVRTTAEYEQMLVFKP